MRSHALITRYRCLISFQYLAAKISLAPASRADPNVETLTARRCVFSEMTLYASRN